MSAGSPKVSIRIPAEVLDQIEAEVASHGQRTRGEPHTLSTWILAAIREKLHHDTVRNRGRGERRRRQLFDASRIDTIELATPSDLQGGIV